MRKAGDEGQDSRTSRKCEMPEIELEMWSSDLTLTLLAVL